MKQKRIKPIAGLLFLNMLIAMSACIQSKDDKTDDHNNQATAGHIGLSQQTQTGENLGLCCSNWQSPHKMPFSQDYSIGTTPTQSFSNIDLLIIGTSRASTLNANQMNNTYFIGMSNPIVGGDTTNVKLKTQ